MSKLDTAPYKGVRDFYPEDQFIQNYIFSVWKQVSERFGYEEYNASLLEPAEIYREKSGDEIVSEQTFTFRDRGDREVTLRPEMTPTLARMVAARRRELGFPLRWYSIPNIFRYEAPQRGRLREHWQLNVDIFGVSHLNAEIELIILADKILKAFGATPDDYEIRLNVSAGRSLSEIDPVIEILRNSGIPNTRIDESLARGQAYYNGIVFEFFDTSPENLRSILGGGRYDNLTGLFGDTELSAAGFGVGDVTVRDFLETHGLLPRYSTSTRLYIAVPDLQLASHVAEVATNLRMAGVNVAIDWTGRKLGDQIHAADKLQIPFVTVIGENEIESRKYPVKELATGRETKATVEEIVTLVSKK